MAEISDSFTQSASTSEQKDNVNINKKHESENNALLEDCQNLEKEDSSLNLALEPLVIIKASDSSSNLLEKVNFDHEAEVREIELQDVQTSENTEETSVEIMNRRLFNIHAACIEYEVRLNSFLHRLRAQIRGCISLRHETRAVQLRETLSQWQPLYDTLVQIISQVELIMASVELHDLVSDRFVRAVMRTCDKLEVHLHNLRSANIPVE